MGAYHRVVACVIAALALAACATVSTTTAESQNKARDSRLARLYFIWPRSMMLKTGTVDIKFDGQLVGKIAPDSYFFVDRPPGMHTLKVEIPFDFSYFESDVQIAAGATYYYSVTIRPVEVSITGGGFVTLSHPQYGAPMQAKNGAFASYKLNVLDPATAAAEIAKLKAQ
jgi:hypothetical protein